MTEYTDDPCHRPRCNEAVLIRRAEKERDDARKAATAEHVRATKAEQERDAWKSTAQETATSIEALRAEYPRPLAFDDITDEMVERARKVWEAAHGCEDIGVTLRRALTAALTEPPARPEGAEEIEADIRELVASHPEDPYGELADHLAAVGYRKDKQ